MKSLIRNSNGFSMVESLLAVALLGGLSLMIVHQSKQSSQMESKMGVNQEVNSVTTQIRSVLGNSANCTATVKGKKVGDTLEAIYAAPELEDIREEVEAQSGDQVFKKGAEITNKRIKLQDIKLIKKEVNGVYLGDFIRLTFKPINHQEMIKDFIIQGEKDGDGAYTTCQSMMGNEIEEGIAQICKSVGARWNEEKKKCYLDNLPSCFLTDEDSCNTEGDDPERKYVDSGSLEFTQYDYTVCTTDFKLKMSPPKCRFAPFPNLASAKCKCQPYGCTCLADERDCASRWQKDCHLEFKVKKLVKCCRGTP